MKKLISFLQLRALLFFRNVQINWDYDRCLVLEFPCFLRALSLFFRSIWPFFQILSYLTTNRSHRVICFWVCNLQVQELTFLSNYQTSTFNKSFSPMKWSNTRVCASCKVFKICQLINSLVFSWTWKTFFPCNFMLAWEEV